ncbi:MAG: Na+/H+ antiporter NhaA [Bacteroidota bacterium]
MPKKKNTIILEGYRDLKQSISRESSKSLRKEVDKLGEAVIFTYKYCPDKNDLNAMTAAKAVIAAEKQGLSEELYQSIMSSKEERSEAFVFQTAKNLGIEMDAFKEDFESEETLARIYQDMEDAKKSGLKVFPGLAINGAPYKGAWDNRSLLNTLEKQGGKHIKMAIESFLSWGASAAAVLIIATLIALAMVNVGFDEIYEHWRHTELGLVFSQQNLILPLEIWINDFLMAIFFLMIGLEIKREVVDGELSDIKSAAMPIIGALGGMVIPAVIYIITNIGADTIIGWGIPMATDIAFTLGLMALLGTKIPLSLKIFISALAVADDLGAIVVIAIFYGHGFHLIPFLGAIVIAGVMFYLNKRNVYNISAYIGLGLVLWLFVFESGFHATLAGVITAILIPSRGKADLPLIAQQANIIFDREVKQVQDESTDQSKITHGSLEVLKNAIGRLREPNEELQHALEKVVNYSILPLFAFFNTGILLSGIALNLTSPGNLGILLGLVVGKPLGIVGACWIASKMKIAKLSQEIKWPQLIGASCLAGVGFTMSIVVASGAFSDEILTASKISILLASTISAVIGLVILSIVSKKPIQRGE